MVIEVNHQLLLRSNLFYGLCKYRALHDVFFLFCLSLLSVAHNSKLIVMKLYQDVEVVSTEKPIDFEVEFLKSSFFIRLTWNLNKICILRHWIGKPTIFEVKGQLKVKLLKSSIFIWKIVNFHPIDLEIKQQLHSASLNLETKCFWGQKVNSRSNL